MAGLAQSSSRSSVAADNYVIEYHSGKAEARRRAELHLKPTISNGAIPFGTTLEDVLALLSDDEDPRFCCLVRQEQIAGISGNPLDEDGMCVEDLIDRRREQGY